MEGGGGTFAGGFRSEGEMMRDFVSDCYLYRSLQVAKDTFKNKRGINQFFFFF